MRTNINVNYSFVFFFVCFSTLSIFPLSDNENLNTVGLLELEVEVDATENPLLPINFFLFFELGLLSVTILAHTSSSTVDITRKIRGIRLILSVCLIIRDL